MISGNSKKLIGYAYFAVIFLLAVLPINGAKSLENIFILNFRGDYLVHSLQFLPFPLFTGFVKLKSSYSFVLGIFCAIGLEAIQMLLPYRSFNINDLFANFLGVVMGYFMLSLTYLLLLKNRK
jgi:VanZ family protein